MAEINGLLNRRTSLKMYRGFESLPHRIRLCINRAFFMFYVYIIFSERIRQFYCGQTNNILFRIQQHNLAETLSNKHGIPWILIGYLRVQTRSDAMKLEKQIKKRGIKRWLDEHKEKLIKEII